MYSKNFKKRILVRIKPSMVVRRLINIQSIYREGKLFEYKITFEGFPKGGFTYTKEALLDTVHGIRKKGSTRILQGHVEVGYHADGNIALKNVGGEGNIWQKGKRIPIARIEKPIHFLRITGISTEKLSPMQKSLTKEDSEDIVIVNPFKADFWGCDFYFSRYDPSIMKRLSVKSNSPFKDFQTFEYIDNEESIVLHLFFYGSSHPQTTIQVIRNDLKSTAATKFWWIQSALVERIKNFLN